MRMYRPVGLKELMLIAASKYHAFPPRLPEQPIFYPVLNRRYAEQIAERWNTIDHASGYAGFVTQFEVAEPYVLRYPIQTVGGAAVHQELWVPAEELADFNAHILNDITVITAYYGAAFVGTIDPLSNLPHALLAG